MQIEQMESIKTFGKEKVQVKIAVMFSRLRKKLLKCVTPKLPGYYKVTFVVTCIVNYFVELSSKGYLNFLHYLDIKKIKWWIIMYFFRMLRNTCCYYKKIAEKVLAV